MERLCRLALGMLLALGVARGGLYLVYAVFQLPTPLEAFHLESKMVLMADRVRAGESLYPSWEAYPHVANFMGPFYFTLVGLLGRVAAADIPGLFSIGRGVSFTAGLGTSLVAAGFLARRYGRGAAVAGAVLSLGASPMYGFSVMVRPDVTAEFLGVAGFFLSGHRGRAAGVAGTGLLVLAALAKQPAGIFLAAAALALALEGRWLRALLVFGGGLLAVSGSVAVLDLTLEPNIARCLLAHARSPWNYHEWLGTLLRVARTSPDLLVFPIVGVVLWSRACPREVRPLALTVVVLGTSLGASMIHGSDLNYYLTLRVVEGLAVGALWQVSRRADSPKVLGAVVLSAAVGAAAVFVSTAHSAAEALAAWRSSEILKGPAGRSFLRTYQSLIRKAEDPGVRILTDSGFLDLHRRERAEFGDPWMFRMLVETGEVRPSRMERMIEAEAYDLVVTLSDINAPGYADYDFGLPMVLVKRARVHYVPSGSSPGFFFYRPRGVAAPAQQSPVPLPKKSQMSTTGIRSGISSAR